jgi:hypothetical protein
MIHQTKKLVVLGSDQMEMGKGGVHAREDG